MHAKLAEKEARMRISLNAPYQGIALKIIAASGVFIFLLLLLASHGLKNSLGAANLQRVSIKEKYSHFNSARAYKDLERILAFGPRPPGSRASAQALDYLKAELKKAGVHYWEQRFDAETPLGTRAMTNLIAEIKGAQEGILLFGNHHDTKYLPKITFLGANDGGSTTAWMLEMARALGPKRAGRTLWLVWFDGEEAFQTWSDTDSLYGSRHFVEKLRASGELERIQAMINVDMIGDCLLRIHRDRRAADWLADIVWETAKRLEYGHHFSDYRQEIEDDHMPFFQAGIPTLEIIDYSYGGSMLDHKKNWHTARDTLDRVCPKSLQAVADVIYHSLPGIEAYLDARGKS